MEDSHSGLVRHLGKVVTGKPVRGFESPILRNISKSGLGFAKLLSFWGYGFAKPPLFLNVPLGFQDMGRNAGVFWAQGLGIKF